MEWPTFCSVCGLGLNQSYLAHIETAFPEASADPTIVAAYCSRECLESVELYEPSVSVDNPDEQP
jgi:hypothetical protein